MNENTFIEYDDGCLYFRVMGWGLWFGSYKRWPTLFSERNGYERVLPLWKWRIRFLTPNP
jgi:hypothetical protein